MRSSSLVHAKTTHGRQNTSLYVVVSRVTTLKGLFLCEKLTADDFKYFRPSKSVLREEERLDALCEKDAA